MIPLPTPERVNLVAREWWVWFSVPEPGGQRTLCRPCILAAESSGSLCPSTPMPPKKRFQPGGSAGKGD